MSYNGWTNYETWLVNLWLEELFTTTEIKDIKQLAIYIEEYLDENNPIKETNGLYCDLMSASLSVINYREIASNILNE